MFRTLLVSVLSFVAGRASAFEAVRPIENYEPGSYGGRIFGCCNRRHLGEDIAAEPLTPVYAIADGEILPVSGAGCRYGMVVVIEHILDDGNHFVSVYGHLSNREGYKPRLRGGVNKGEVIGHVAHSGGQALRNDCKDPDDENGDGDSHLHFAIRLGASPRWANGTFRWVYHGYWGSGQDVDFDSRGRPHGGKFTSPVKFLAQFGVTPTNIDNDSDGLTENEGDCDDTDPTARPNTFERCNNNRDDNCDGVTDEEIHPLGEGCMFKHEGCLYEGVWLCGEGGETLCTPFQPLTCVCQDECQNVGAGTCIIDNGRSAARICAADNASLCNKFIIMPCSSHTCEEGRCGPVSRGQPCQSSNECQGGNRCIRSNCTNRSVCTNYCSFDRDCARCEVCAPAQNGHACFRGINYGFSADIEDGCPCASKTEPKCEDGNPCSPGSFCALERPGEELPYPCFMAGYGQECTCYRL